MRLSSEYKGEGVSCEVGMERALKCITEVRMQGVVLANTWH